MNLESLSKIAAQRYDNALSRSQKRRKLPDDIPQPQPATTWPKENITLLADYWIWLEEENSTRNCIENIYIPMAGHVLGLNLKPHTELHLEEDLAKAMAYIEAKQMSASWTDICLRALNRFRRFLRYQRCDLAVDFADTEVCLARYHDDLPDWFIEQITQMQHLRQANWRPARLPDAIRRFWANHTRLWSWLFAQEGIEQPKDIKRQHLFTYIDERLVAGYAVTSINQDLRAFQATLRFLQERDFPIPLALLHVPTLKEPDALPRFLTDEEVSCLQANIEQQVPQASVQAEQRNALLDRAIFYLLWHAGLRLGEVEELHLDDLSLGQQQLIVRQGKGMKDRTVYLTTMTATAIKTYLKVRGDGQSGHLFLFRHLPLRKGFVHWRLKMVGKRTGIKVTAHRLRHTCATQLLNAGCPITTIKELLGHRRLHSTLIYARVHDRTVAEDYYAAMTVIEKRMQPHLPPTPEQTSTLEESPPHENNPLLTLLNNLENGDLDDAQRKTVTELRQEILALES